MCLFWCAHTQKKLIYIYGKTLERLKSQAVSRLRSQDQVNLLWSPRLEMWAIFNIHPAFFAGISIPNYLLDSI